MPHNVAIVGQFATGKTTLANEFIRRGYSRASLAMPLKAWAESAYGPIEKGGLYEVTREDGNVESITGRQVWQETGQAIKAMDRDFWVKVMLRYMADGVFGDGPFVVDDCRFWYEAEALRRNDFLIVRLNVPEGLRMDRYFKLYGRYPSQAEREHPSETGVWDIKADIELSGWSSIPEANADFIEHILKEVVAA